MHFHKFAHNLKVFFFFLNHGKCIIDVDSFPINHSILNESKTNEVRRLLIFRRTDGREDGVFQVRRCIHAWQLPHTPQHQATFRPHPSTESTRQDALRNVSGLQAAARLEISGSPVPQYLIIQLVALFTGRRNEIQIVLVVCDFLCYFTVNSLSLLPNGHAIVKIHAK